MKLSIVICVYNTDYRLFENCLKSIRASTLDGGDYEIVVIDDGSSVDYSELRERYSLRYIKTENRGIFRARLLGASLALGEYTAFVDSDDTVSFNFHRSMLDEAERSDADIVIGGWAFHADRGRHWCKRDSTLSEKIDKKGAEVLSAFLEREGREHSYFVLWNKLFRSELLKSACMSAEAAAGGTERFNYSEDALICFYAFSAAARLVNVRGGFYFYRIHSAQTVNVISEQRLRSQICCMGKTFDAMLLGVADNPDADALEAHILAWRALMARSHYSHASANKYVELYDYIKEVYKTDKLSLSKFKDGAVYASNKLLPKNFDEIEEELVFLWNTSVPTQISPRGADAYTKTALEYIAEHNENVTLTERGRRLPKPKTKLKDRIIMNSFVYTVGMLLFKKGSKIRAFLKRHL